MSNKPAIPAWQRASTDASSSPPQSQTQQNSPERSTEAPTPTEEDVEEPVEAPKPTEEDVVDVNDESAQPDEVSLLEQASRFLDDPTIRDAPREKKVAFLQSKGIQPEDIDTLLGVSAQENESVDLDEVGHRAWSTVRPGNAHTTVLKSIFDMFAHWNASC